MNLKLSSAVICAIVLHSNAAFAVLSYPISLQQPPETSSVTQTYDAATGIYNIHVDKNDFGAEETRPTIRFAVQNETLPEFAKTLSFDYKSTRACSEQKFICYN
ncbi:MAG: hypothetical protein K2M98_05455, partial [Muribaculum sp.]|nr:hypothetical protein [Muribaculum sp.]